MYQVVQLATEGFRKINLVLEAGVVIQPSTISNIDNTLPDIMLVTHTDTETGVLIGDLEPLIPVLRFCHDNGIYAKAIEDTVPLSEVSEGSATFTFIKDEVFKGLHYVAVVDGVESTVGYSSVVEALIAAYITKTEF